MFTFFSPIGACAQNEVFTPGSTAEYAVEYTGGASVVHDTISIHATGRPWQADATQKEIIITYLADGIDSTVFGEQFSIGWVSTDTTGAVENEKTCWFHPPRHNQYAMLESAPFPRVNYPLALSKTYSRVLFIGEGWGELSNSKITWVYEVIENEGTRWRVSASAISEKEAERVNRLDFTFCENEGFLELNYTFHNQLKVKLRKIIRQ